MQLALTEEQRLLRESAERFVAEQYTFAQRRATVASDAGMSEAIWREVADFGWLGMTLPEQCGGLAWRQSDRLVLFEALGRGMLIEPLLPTACLAGELIAIAGSEAQQAQYLPKLIDGTWRPAAAYGEPQSRHNPAAVHTTARRDANGYVLAGTKTAVVGLPWAHAAIVSARTSGDDYDASGVSLFIVPCEAAGVTIRSFGAIDGSRAAEIILQNVRVSEDARLANEGAGVAALEHALDLAAAAAVAEAVGAIRALNEATAEYLRTRKQFGQPIGTFQALQHRMANMYMAEQRAAAVLAMLRGMLDGADERTRQRIVSAAKIQIGRCGRYVGQQAVQLHGGIGVSDELVVGHYFKRLAAIECSFGDTAYHLDRFARLTQDAA